MAGSAAGLRDAIDSKAAGTKLVPAGGGSLNSRLFAVGGALIVDQDRVGQDIADNVWALSTLLTLVGKAGAPTSICVAQGADNHTDRPCEVRAPRRWSAKRQLVRNIDIRDIPALPPAAKVDSRCTSNAGVSLRVPKCTAGIKRAGIAIDL